MNQRHALGQYFPAPLVATTVLLVLLILLTPVLSPNGSPPAGSILTQATLLVDHPQGGNLTTFYLRALGSTVRYASISVWSAANFSWTNGFPGPPLTWVRIANQTSLVALQFNTTSNPLALNITMLYTSGNSRAYYIGVFAFYFGFPLGSTTPTMFSVTTTSGTSLGSGVTSVPESSLPAGGEILLADNGGSP